MMSTSGPSLVEAVMSAIPASSPFSIEINRVADTAVVHCTGQLTAENTAILKEPVKDLMTQAPVVRIDLAGVPFVDSAGLGTLVSLYMSARKADCDLKVVHLNDQVRNLLRITNLLWVLEDNAPAD
jgi:anti-anti-sigma factor